MVGDSRLAGLFASGLGVHHELGRDIRGSRKGGEAGEVDIRESRLGTKRGDADAVASTTHDSTTTGIGR